MPFLALSSPRRRPLALLRLLVLWSRTRRTRRQLAGLDPHLLADIGLTEAQARAESARPFWRG